MATTVPYEPYRDEDPTRFRWRLGLRPLSLDAWLQFDADADADLAQKRDRLNQNRATVLARHSDPATVDVVDQACRELYDLVTAWIAEYAPERAPSVDAGLAVTELPTLPGRDLLEAAALLVQEDLVLLVPTEQGLVLGAGCVCFPNKWDLRSKIGRTMSGIHQPVPRLNDELAEPIDSFLDRLRVDRPFWRLGWTVTPTEELYLAVDGSAVADNPDDPTRYTLRVERETLRRLPQTNAVLFTIRTYRTPLGVLPADSAAALAIALQSLPPDVDQYKALDSIGADAVALLHTLT